MKARWAEDRKREERRRRAEAAKAARRASSWWDKCLNEPPGGENGYLKRKAVGAHGVRFSPSGNLVIPGMDANAEIHFLQVIYGDPKVKERKGRDKDFVPTGCTKKGHFFLIGSPVWVVLICEGYATGASLHEATGLPVMIAFDAGNLVMVAQIAQRQYPRAKILICADDDWLTRCTDSGDKKGCQKYTPVDVPDCKHCGKPHGKGNAGAASASAAALAIDGAWIQPTFTDRGDHKWSDFNDLHLAEGLHVVRVQIERKLAERRSADSGPHANSGAAGSDGGNGDFNFTWRGLLENYVLIYGTETVFDQRHRDIITLASLRAAAGKAKVREWLESANRKIARRDQIVFEPAGTPEGCYNLWGGWPTSPGSGSCERLLELLEFLCSADENATQLYDWLLCWLAYPLQHPGAKMQSAVLVHGEEGTGKNLFFGAYRDIYERYGGLFSQTELESQFNGWASRKLFMIGNEVVSRAELYHQQGRLKNMITEPEWQVNDKNLPVRLEANHCNFVFLSNRLDIAKLDQNDRRYCVVWVPKPNSEEFYQQIKAELDAGGAAALHRHLLDVNLEGFGPHTKPPMTRAKRDLIDLSLDSTDRFWRDWTAGHLPVRCGVCKTRDLYNAYRTWAAQTGVFKPAPEHVLLGALKKKTGTVTSRERFLRGMDQQQAMVLFPPDRHAPPGLTGPAKVDWLTTEVSGFAADLHAWRNPSMQLPEVPPEAIDG